MTDNNKKEDKRTRGPVWTEVESLTLIDMVSEEEDQLFGNHDGLSKEKVTTSRKRADIWLKIVNTLNSRSTAGAKRNVDEVQKKYYNMKQRVKQKTDQNVKYQRQTGGGPAPAPLSNVEEHLLSKLEGRPQIKGINGTDTDRLNARESIEVDEAATSSSFQAEEISCSSSTTSTVALHTDNQHPCLLSQPETEQGAVPRKGNKGKKRKLETTTELTNENLTLDNERLKVNIAKMKAEMDLINAYKETEILKQAKLKVETEYLSWKLKVEFTAGLPLFTDLVVSNTNDGNEA